MKSVAPGVFVANFRILGAETSAFCNHAAQTGQVAVKGIFRFSKARAGPAPKTTDHAGYAVIFDDSGSEDHLYKLPNARFGASADLPLCEIVPDQLSSSRQ
ncbi:hypothetical protein [Rhizobium leguminosarum]|uniref:hypothetical protein n=1 Tax=Rhizobium leguminosarum TaxID=384 RepID=UPI0014419F25|nr:hypothetical protein [Rhizobium leguminosarum]